MNRKEYIGKYYSVGPYASIEVLNVIDNVVYYHYIDEGKKSEKVHKAKIKVNKLNFDTILVMGIAIRLDDYDYDNEKETKT